MLKAAFSSGVTGGRAVTGPSSAWLSGSVVPPYTVGGGGPETGLGGSTAAKRGMASVPFALM